VKSKGERCVAIYTAYSAWVSTTSLCSVFLTRQSSATVKCPTVSSFFQIRAARFTLYFITSSDYHSYFILTGKASELIFSKLIGEQKEVFRKLRTKISLCPSATVTFSSTFASFYLNRLILHVVSPSNSTIITCQ